MGNRLHFREFLLSYISIPDKPIKLYFQAPGSERMVYPCILYQLDRIGANEADNRPYKTAWVYELTLIDRDPDSPFVQKLSEVPGCRSDRYYVADNLHHWTFRVHHTGTFQTD